LGEKHPNIADTLNNLALLYSYQGLYDKAETLLQQALEIAKYSLDTNHPKAIKIRENLESLHNYLNSL
jgi:tetratricopeptide (TPR) repeat protein